jgi:hypothetical protein
VPHCLEPRAVGPLRACHPWNVSRIFVPRRTTLSYPAVRHRFSPHASRRRSLYHGIEAGVPSPCLPIKVTQRPEPQRPQLMPAALPVRPTEEPLLRPVCCRPAPSRSPLRPYSLPVPPLPLPRPEARLSTARSDRAHGAPPAGRLPVPPPIRVHKSTAGEPLFLSHSFPGQTPHRSRPISLGTAASMAKGLHCISLVLSRVFFVNRGPIRDRNRNARDLPVKPSLK